MAISVEEDGDNLPHDEKKSPKVSWEPEADGDDKEVDGQLGESTGTTASEQQHELLLIPLQLSHTEDATVPFQRSSAPKKSNNGNCFMAIFATRQLASRGNRELYIKYSVRELIIYSVYLATFCTMVFVNHSTSTFYYTKVMRDLFVEKAVTRESDVDADNTKTFETSTDVRDFWNYIEGPMLEGLYWENWYGAPGADKTNVKNLYVQELVSKEEKKYGILYENQLMGLPRLRQVRVHPVKCPVGDNFRQLHRECFPDYSFDVEDKGNQRREWKGFPEATLISAKEVENGWKYRTGVAGSWHWGHLSWYTGNGAALNLEREYASSRQRMKQLKQNLWITRATRAVFLDFTVYNANINLFCVVKLVWEFPSTGGVMTSSTLRTVKLIRYQTFIEQYVVLPAEILFVVFTLYYLIQELVEMVFLGCPAYLLDLWTWLDITILITSMICIAFSVYRYDLVEKTLYGLTTDVAKFHNFEFLGYWETQFNHAVSTCLFFSWVKVFKYISFNRTMSQLSSTLSRCAKDIGGFAIMFFIVFFAFAQLGYLLFGSQVEDFSTFLDATFTLLRLILGDFNFRQIEAANRALGPIYFLAYVFFVFFVLLNMFLAIINDTYSEVKAEIQARRNEFEIADYFKRWGNNIRGKIGTRSTKLDAEASIKLAAADGQITYDELRDNLQRSGFNDMEIELFLARFDLDQDKALNEEETQQVLRDLEGGLTRNEGHGGTTRYHNSMEEVSLGLTKASPGIRAQTEDYTNIHERVQVIETALTEFIHAAAQIMEMVQTREKQSSHKGLELDIN